jgi:hypothetical protein
LAGFLINLVIGVGSDAWEEYEENMAIAASANANEEDKNNAMSVIAIDI